LKLSLWKTQLSGDDTVHFLCLKSMCTTGLNTDLNFTGPARFSLNMPEVALELKRV